MGRLLFLATLVTLVLPLAFAASANASASDLPPGGQLVATILVPSPHDITTGFDSVWVTSGRGRRVTRIDPLTNSVNAVIPTGVNATDVTIGAGAVWISSLPSNVVLRVDPATNAVVATIPSGGLAPDGILYFDGYVWVANHHGSPTGSLAKIDPATDTVVEVIPLGAAQFSGGPTELAAGAGSVWTGVPNLGAVARIDPTSDQVDATIPVNGVCAALAATDTAVWIAGGSGPGCSPGITRLDPATNQVVGDKINAGGPVYGLGLGLGSLWFGAPLSNFLGRVDPTTDAIVGQLKLPGSPDSGHTPTGFGSVWVGDSADNLLFRVDPT